MRKFFTLIFSFLMMQYCVMFGQSNHSVTFSGSAGDFNTAEKIYGGDNVDYYVTYDNTYMYFAAFKVNGDNFSEYHHFMIYIDSDPTSAVSSGGTGSTTGVGWDDATPTLPFQANYRICLRRANFGESFYSSYSGSWTTGGANAKGYTQYATTTALEVRVPLSDIGSPTGIYFLMYMSYGGGGFYGVNNSPTYPTTHSGSTFSGYFGGFGFRKGVTPVNEKNTPVTLNGTNGTSGNFVNLTINSNTTLSSATKIVQGGSLALSGGALTAGSNLTIEDGALINRSNGSVSGTITFPSSGTVDLTYSQASSQIAAGSELSSNSGIYRDLTINTSNGVSIDKDIIIGNNAGTLSLTSGSLAIGSSNTVNLIGGSTLAATSGSLAAQGKISFNGSATVTGTVAFNNVDIAGGINFGSNSTINGTLKINSGGWLNTVQLHYGSSSTIQYNTGGTYGRSNEWLNTADPVYPANIKISNNTTLDLGNDAPGTARKCSGSITIDNGSTLSMNVHAMTASLTVLGGITNNGTLTLSGSTGGDLYVSGDFTNNGTFNSNGRDFYFAGSTQQNFACGSSATTNLSNMVITNPNGVALGSMPGSILNISSKLKFAYPGGSLVTGSDTVVLASAATVDSEKTGRYVVGTLKTTKTVGTSSSTFGGLGLSIAAGIENLGDVTVTRYSGTAGAVTANGHTGINRKWKLAATGSSSFASRNLTLNWVSDDDNSKSMTTAVGFQSTDDGSTWAGYTTPTDVSSSRSLPGTVNKLGWFTVSDNANALGSSLSVYTVNSGNWNNSAIWSTGSVPGSGVPVIINHDVTLNTDATIASLTINAGKTLTASDATPRVLTIAASGSLVNNGTFTHASGTVSFAGAGSVSGTVAFYNVTIAGAIDFGSAATINGTLRINSGGSINTNPPSYASGSTLFYNTGGTYNRNSEWSAASGAGYPYNVEIGGSTTLDLSANSGTATARQAAGSLTIDASSTLTMSAMTKELTVNGDITNNGTITLSTQIGGDLYVKGNFTNNSILNPNNRELLFSGTTQQTFNIATSVSLQYLAVSNPAGILLGTMPSNSLQVANRVRFVSGAGNLNTGSDTLVLASGATLENETNSGHVLGIIKMTKTVGTSSDNFGGSIGTLSGGTENLGDVTLYRYTGTSGIVTKDSYSGIKAKWKLTATGSQTFAARTITLNWFKTEDNSKDTTAISIYQSTDAGSTWAGISNFQAVNYPRSFSASITKLGLFTATDMSNSLGSHSQIFTIADGNWNTASTWNANSVPASGSTVIINNNVTVDANINAAAITIRSGKTFTASDAGARTITIAAGGSLTNNGTFTHGSGTISFAGAGTITGTIIFNNVTLGGAVNFGSASTVEGTLRINSGGSVATNLPTYSSTSTLQYATGGTFNRSLEWSAGSGAGYPQNVQISNNTIVDISAGTTGVRKIGGSLTVDSGSKLYMNAMTDSLSIYGGITNNGTIELSSAVGGDLRVKGSFTNSGTLTTHTREFVFAGTTEQSFSSSSTTSLEYVAVANPAGLTLSSVPSGEFQITNRLRFLTGAGNLNTGSNTLVLGSSISTLSEAAGSYIVGTVKLTKTVGTNSETFAGLGVTIPAGSENLGDVTLYRYTGTAGVVTVGSASGISRKWRLTNTGTKNFASRTLTLSWISSDDNGKNLAAAQVYASSNSGSTWFTVGSSQNASSTRSVSAATDSLRWFTVSDASNQLYSAFTLSATALAEALWNGTTTVQDTMTAEIRSASSPYSLITSAKAYSTSAGALSFTFGGLQNSTSYYLVIKHRNALAVWSANPISFTASAASYDFTTGAAQAYGSNMILKNSKYCMYSGDINGDGVIDLSDLATVDNAANTGATGYVAADIDGSGTVNYTDLRLCDANIVRHLKVKSPSASKDAAKPDSKNKQETSPAGN